MFSFLQSCCIPKAKTIPTSPLSVPESGEAAPGKKRAAFPAEACSLIKGYEVGSTK
jgi:hypothetical protein